MSKNIEYIIDDTPRNYMKYINMPAAERRAEIERLEAEARKERDRIAREEQLKAV